MPVSFSQKLIYTVAYLAIAIAVPAHRTMAQQPAAQQPAGETPQHSPEGITKQNPPPAAPAQTSGVAGTLSDGTVVQNRVTPPRLQFTEAQRVQIRAAVNERSSVVDFPLGTADAAKSFQPTIGAGVPGAMEGQTLPTALTDQIPALKDYIYLKLPAQAVIVDPMSRKVAEIVSLP